MRILGINAGLHDSSAAIVVDGRLVAFSAEERLTRRKHDGEYPHEAIRACLREANLAVEDIDVVAYGWNYFDYEVPKLVFHIERSLEIARREAPERGLEYLASQLERKKALYERYRSVDRETEKVFGRPPVHIDHHVAHAYSAFPFAGAQRSAVLVVDGSGELMCSSIWHYDGTQLRFLRSWDLPHSLGVFYGAITQYLGFLHHDEEWKVMGWAAYGEPRYANIIRRMVSPETLALDLSYFQHQFGESPWYSRKLVEELGMAPREKEAGFEQAYADIAASAQLVLEECILSLAREAQELTGERVLAMAGGVALNGLANGRILEAQLFERIFVQPAAADDGIAIGAALKVAHDRGELRVGELPSAYLGPNYDDGEHEAALVRAKLPFRRLSEEALLQEVAEDLASGKVVGWLQGRSELGPRALGHRSILADPRRAEMKAVLNAKIKFREPFRPFAPSVLAEHATDYFEGNLGRAYYMNQIFRVREDKRAIIPAVTHMDGTARIQVVRKDMAPRYHALISRFHELTGVPVVINTSFNVKGEPVVDSPQDAINCFLATGIDTLVLGHHISRKR